MKFKYIILIVFLFTLLIAAITNPPAEAHKTKIKSEVRALVDSVTHMADTPFSGLTGLITNTAIDLGFDQAIVVDNYVFFSICRIKFAAIDQPIGMGIFGNVFLFKSLNEVVKGWASGQVGLDIR